MQKDVVPAQHRARNKKPLPGLASLAGVYLFNLVVLPAGFLAKPSPRPSPKRRGRNETGGPLIVLRTVCTCLAVSPLPGGFP